MFNFKPTKESEKQSESKFKADVIIATVLDFDTVQVSKKKLDIKESCKSMIGQRVGFAPNKKKIVADLYTKNGGKFVKVMTNTPFTGNLNPFYPYKPGTQVRGYINKENNFVIL